MIPENPGLAGAARAISPSVFSASPGHGQVHVCGSRGLENLTFAKLPSAGGNETEVLGGQHNRWRFPSIVDAAKI